MRHFHLNIFRVMIVAVPVMMVTMAMMVVTVIMMMVMMLMNMIIIVFFIKGWMVVIMHTIYR